MPCTSSHFCREAERTNPSKLPRGCSPCPPQFAEERSGTLIFDQSGMRERQYSSLASGLLQQSAKKSRRLAPSSSSVSVGYWRSEERRVGKECRSRWSPY